ncbi:MAG: ThuA domain-containing protein [Miltoncostaeaceae bacterium]
MRRWVALAACCAAVAATPGAGSAAEARVLLVTETAGFEHDVIPTARRTMRRLGARSPRYRIVDRDGLGELRPARLRRYDAVVFALTSGELALSVASRRALIRFVQRGGGFVGVHSATDTLYSFPTYGRMVGAYFRDHPYSRGRLVRTGPRHPATARMPRRSAIREELYRFRTDPRRVGAKVLLRLDPSTVPGASPREFLPIAWCRRLGRGRVYYNALGHLPSTWRSGRFRAQLDGGIAWAAGRRAGAC